MKYQKGYTLPELVMVGAAIFVFLLFSLGIVAIAHFIVKHW